MAIFCTKGSQLVYDQLCIQGGAQGQKLEQTWCEDIEDVIKYTTSTISYVITLKL